MSFFGLTSLSLFIFVTILLILVLVWAIAWVPGHQWRSWRRWLQQGLAVILSALLAVFTAFVGFNRSSLWYASWSDLFGFLNQDLETTQIGAPGTASSTPTPTPTPTEKPKPKFSDIQMHPEKNPVMHGQLRADAPEGQWLNLRIGDQGTRGDSFIYVWLPPSYMTHPDREYPVIMAFPGVPGTPTSYNNPLHFDQAIIQAVNEKKMREAIVVSPNMFPHDLDTECIDFKGAGVETWLTKEIVPWLKTNLRVTQTRDSWATIGYSAGGWCANLYTMRYPTIFGASMSMSGYYDPKFPYKGIKLAPDYTLSHVADTAAPNVHMWNYSGKGDGIFRASFDQFVKHVKPPLSVTSVEIQGSSHRWPVWEKAQHEALAWLGATLPAFAAQ